jgi:hypothetical protein
MKQHRPTTRLRSILAGVALVSIIPLTLSTPASGADTPAPVAPIVLTAPSGIPGVAALPFTGVTAPTFTTPATMTNLAITPNQGIIGTPITISGAGLPASTTLQLTWSTANGNWQVDADPSTVNYRGPSYTKYHVILASVTTDASGNFSFKTSAPSDFGGVHDIFAVQNGVALAHGGFQMVRTVTISPKSGPIGTPITITYTAMGASLYAGGAAVLYDNHFTGEMQAQWTRGTAVAKIRAAGPIGTHFIQVGDAIGTLYMNIVQSPIPYANGDTLAFKVTKDKGLIPAYMTWPSEVKPSVSLRTTLTNAGLDPASSAVATLSKTSGPVNTKTTLNVTGLPSTVTGTVQLAWSTVVGSRVNCGTGGTCWAFSALPLGQATVTNGSINQEVTIPDHLGGFHVIQVMKGAVVEAQVPFYVKESLVPFYDKAGKLISMATATATNAKTPEAFAVGQSGVGSTTFKAGQEFTVSMRGVGWTQMDNTLAVTYDNSYVGYGCGFNSNGYMVIKMRATGEPGTHIIDLWPLMYTNLPSFSNTPYGMLPVLTSDRDLPGLALGYQIPTVHLTIKIVK